MQQYKRDFIEFMVRSDVLTFGDFTTKSGRQTPFFINTGRYRTGEQLAQLGDFYAAAIDESWPDDVDILFGPAYKGIPLVATASIGLAARGRDIGYLFNRKEAKDHGEGGTLVGAPLQGRVMIVDDVISAGTAVRESLALITAAGATPHALAIALDRQEMATEVQADGQVRDVPYSAVQYVQRQLGLTVCAVATLDDLLAHLAQRPDGAPQVAQVQAYRQRYGVAA